MSASFLTGLSQRLTRIVGDLRTAVAARGGRDRSIVKLVVLTHGWLGRLLRRFDALVARLAAGRAARGPRPATRTAGTAAPRVRLPQGQAWLVRRMQETAVFGLHLQALLADPAMSALLAEEPAAERMLRPLCRMLAVEMPAVLRWVDRPVAGPAAAHGAGPAAAGIAMGLVPARGPSGAGTILAADRGKPPWSPG